LSFGKSPGRSGSVGSQKKDRRRKQEFHHHKIKLADEEKLDFASLKERVVLSLTHLGKQQFSQETGGYGFANWIKNFNMLLDDFEKKAGQNILPKEYFEKRQEITAKLLRPSKESELDSDISKLQLKERTQTEKLQKMGAKLSHDRESTDRVAKIDALNIERAGYVERLASEKKRLVDRRKEIEDSNKFFKRLFSGSKTNGASVASIEAKIEELEEKVENLDRRISELRAKHDSGGYRILTDQELEQAFPEQFSELEETRTDLANLESTKLAEKEKSELREQATNSMSEIISKIGPSEENISAATPIKNAE
jgi:chromosome segregation ATPase